MQRHMRTKRIYFLGDYRNIEFEDQIDEIPAKLAVDDKFTGALRFVQLVNIELAYRKYLQLMSKVPHAMALEEAIAELESLRSEALDVIKTLINGDMES